MRTTTQNGRPLKRNERNTRAYMEWQERKKACNRAKKQIRELQTPSK